MRRSCLPRSPWRPPLTQPNQIPQPQKFLFGGGTPVFVKILSAEPDGVGGAKVNGSMRVVDQESGADLDPTGELAASRRGGPGGGGGGPLSDQPPEEGAVVRGVVKRIEAYGVFVGLEGYRRQGLVHASQVRLGWLTFGGGVGCTATLSCSYCRL